MNRSQYDGEGVKAKCQVCGTFIGKWFIVEGCNCCPACVERSIASQASGGTEP